MPNIAEGRGRAVSGGDIEALAAAVGGLVRTPAAALERPAEALLPLHRGQTSADMFADLTHQRTANSHFQDAPEPSVGWARLSRQGLQLAKLRPPEQFQ